MQSLQGQLPAVHHYMAAGQRQRGIRGTETKRNKRDRDKEEYEGQRQRGVRGTEKNRNKRDGDKGE